MQNKGCPQGDFVGFFQLFARNVHSGIQKLAR